MISGCTMEGPAHDTLHGFLVAWIPEVKALALDTELPAATERLRRMKVMLGEVERVFE